MKETIVLLVRLLGKFGLVLIERNSGWVLDRINEGVELGLVLLKDCCELACWLRESAVKRLASVILIQ